MSDEMMIMVDHAGEKECVSVSTTASIAGLRQAIAACIDVEPNSFDILLEDATVLDDDEKLSDIPDTDGGVTVRINEKHLAKEILKDEGVLVDDYYYKMTTNSSQREGNVDVIEKILRTGADPNAKAVPGKDWSPLSKASYNGNCAAATVLVQYGARVDHKDHGGWTPLHHAADYGAPDILEMLLDNGADIDLTDNKSKTALHWASHRNSIRCIKILLKRGCALGKQDWLSRTPLHWAGVSGNIEATAALVAAGAPLGVVSNDGTVFGSANIGMHRQVFELMAEELLQRDTSKTDPAPLPLCIERCEIRAERLAATELLRMGVCPFMDGSFDLLEARFKATGGETKEINKEDPAAVRAYMVLMMEKIAVPESSSDSDQFS